MVLLAMWPVVASGQVGRHFVTAEAYVGLCRVAYVGKIVELEETEYKKPLEAEQNYGKPHRVVVEVAETIRGEPVKRLELVLAVQNKVYLQYMRDNAIFFLLVASPQPIDTFPFPEIGIEEQGKPVTVGRYHFRVMDPVAVPESGDGTALVRQINLYYDSCRMFTNELGLVTGSQAILERMRAFAKKYPDMREPVMLGVPNEFGALCGSPGAFCGILMPACPETRTTLEALKKDPGLILRQVKVPNPERSAEAIVEEVDKALALFPAAE